MSECLTVIVDGLDLNVDTDLVRRAVEDVEDWDSGAEVRTVENWRPHGGGLFDEDSLIGGLSFSVIGSVQCATHSQAVAERSAIGRLLADGGSGLVQIGHESEDVLWSLARKSGTPSFSWSSPTDFDYRLKFTSSDPYRYGTHRTGSTGFASDSSSTGLIPAWFNSAGVMDWGAAPASDGTVTLVNAGTAPARPVFTIAGPVTAGVRISAVSSGIVGRFSADIPDGGVVEIDSRTGSATINGQADRTAFVHFDSWPTIPAGGSETFAFAPEGSSSSAVLTVSADDTYH